MEHQWSNNESQMEALDNKDKMFIDEKIGSSNTSKDIMADIKNLDPNLIRIKSFHKSSTNSSKIRTNDTRRNRRTVATFYKSK